MRRSSSSVSGLPLADAHSWTSENTRSSSAPEISSQPFHHVPEAGFPAVLAGQHHPAGRVNQSSGNGPSVLSSYSS